jgi:hypothetical protein
MLVWTAYSTREGELMRTSSPERNIAVRGTFVLTVENGTITCGLDIWDVAGGEHR